jgi:DNA helicase HerA-like ATPase
MSDDQAPDSLTEQIRRYREVRDTIERGLLPLATSVDGRTFELQASLHGLALRRGSYVALESETGTRLGQVTDLDRHTDHVEIAGSPGSAITSVVVRAARGAGGVFDTDGAAFHDARVRPAEPDEVSAWLARTRPNRAQLVIGELLSAPGVPAALDSGGLNRHTFMCGQSGSGKTYSLGLLLERVMAETRLRMVVLDPNSDYVGLGTVREGADEEDAARYRSVTDEVTVWGNEATADRRLRLRFGELTPQAQAAILGLDPVEDRDEYAALNDLLRRDADGAPPITGFDDLLNSPDEGARGLGVRASNLGVLDWSVWSRQQHPSLLQELRNPTSRCTVVDLGSLETVEEQHLVAEAVLSTLWATRTQREPCLVVIDEAHNICAADPADPVSRLATDRAVQIAAEGRKYGLYLLVSTQRPNKVHENVVSQCDNLLMMRMNSHADLADLGRLFSFVPAGLLAGAPSFRMGQVLVAGRIFPQSGYVQMGARVSEEGGADIPLAWASTHDG